MKKRIEEINTRIEAACKRAGRSRDEVMLMGVTKTFPTEVVREAIEAGLNILGENRVQEAQIKILDLKELAHQHRVRWHFIGSLQSNKARRAVELFDVIESVNNLKLAERLNSISTELYKKLPVYIEVNLGGESSKSGSTPSEALALIENAAKLPNLELLGLMTVPPWSEDPEQSRPYFQQLRKMRDDALKSGIVADSFKGLSMGMSGDFEVAIEEGATMVRVGTAIFGKRTNI